MSSQLDARRVRAASVTILRAAAQDGDSLLAEGEVIERMDRLSLSHPCVVTADWLKANEPSLSRVVERLTRWLSGLDPMRFSRGYSSIEGWDLPALRRRLDELAEAIAHERFLAERVALGEQLAREREKAVGYFEAQEAAVRQIAIDNIRHARLDDLYRRRQEALTALQRRGELVPDLKLEQVAVVDVEVGR